MKFNVEKREVSSVGEISSRKITLSANAKAFRLIFGQIYPNIIKAIVRELFTNGWDSQKMAGNLDTPIDIHVPSNMEPYFSIRDYGTGMSKELIDDMYSKTFESTKDNSNDEAGMFGMGSKTPLGYTDAFTLISYVDGIYWYYEIYLDVTGEPIISLKATGETSEPNGVLVQLAVNEKDFQEFTNWTEFFAFGANTPININRKKFLETYEVIDSGKDWEIVKSSKINRVHIRMGCVLYKVDPNYLSSRNYDYNIYNAPIVLSFEIGDFDVTGSREDLIYDTTSSAKIEAKIEDIRRVHTEKIRAQIKNAPSYLEAYRIYNNAVVEDKSGFFKKDEKFLWKTLKLYSRISNAYFKRRHIEVQILNSYTYKVPRDFNSDVVLKDLLSRKMTYVIFEPTEEKVVRAGSRIRNFIEKNRYNYGTLAYWVRAKRIEDIKRFYVWLPHVVVVHINDIDKFVDPAKQSHNGNKAPDTAYLLDVAEFEGYNYYPPKLGRLSTVEDGDLYVKVSYKTFEDNPKTIEKMVKYLKSTKRLADKKVFCLQKLTQKYITIHNMISLEDFYNEETKKEAYTPSTHIHHNLRKYIDQLSYADWRKYALKNAYFLNKYFKAAFPEYKKDEIENDKFYNENLTDAIYKESETYYNRITVMFDEFQDKYPIIKYIDDAYISGDLENILTTIEEMKK